MPRPARAPWLPVEPATIDADVAGLGGIVACIYAALCVRIKREIPWAIVERVAVLAARLELSVDELETALAALEQRGLVIREGWLIYLPALLRQHSTVQNPNSARYYGGKVALLPAGELRDQMDADALRVLGGRAGLLAAYRAGRGLSDAPPAQLNLPVGEHWGLTVLQGQGAGRIPELVQETKMDDDSDWLPLPWAVGDKPMAAAAPGAPPPPNRDPVPQRPPTGDVHGDTGSRRALAENDRPLDGQHGGRRDRRAPLDGQASPDRGHGGNAGALPRGRSGGTGDAPDGRASLPGALPASGPTVLECWSAIRDRAGVKFGLGLKLGNNAGLSVLGIAPHLEGRFASSVAPLLAAGLTVADLATLGDFIAADGLRYSGNRAAYVVCCEDLEQQLNRAATWRRGQAAKQPQLPGLPPPARVLTAAEEREREFSRSLASAKRRREEDDPVKVNAIIAGLLKAVS